MNSYPTKSEYEDLDAESGYYDGSSYEHFVSSSNVRFFSQRSYKSHHHIDVNDRTSLLKKPQRLRPNCIDARVFSLGVLFIGGITVGTYLLLEQGRQWSITTTPLRLDLVNREDWSGDRPLLTAHRLFSNNVSHVLLHHTSTENCFELAKCKQFLQNYQKMWLQKENIDIPFNYLIGGDGRAYEVRGWSIQSNSDIRRNTSLSIGLIGNFTETVPSEKQLNTVWALMLELKYQRKISRNCHIIGVSDHKRSHHDGAALFREMSMFLIRQTLKWECWDEVYSIY